ncbi:4-(cytidine 5'-diphospho)-2-C-methyl-D-erythritol kinase [Branchiibius sp. NY16-3462-2]|uniref:4-(cytidine 5'-diphospho)-2-C-methyl-D-erythritol kinase n=1 Tax=Branchiibius sp. NY16-3462-2 TaxID=1807500 RepID=UPI000794B387|nr:4-(cytidine 5'-diphospho)-2-C-methyl-D-erythritol kinase [Branchiibius sp. NY16-3462-2]KYH45678.1 hypothetical protein AZH51_18375 [Branchiibius sp. NY16-3462-2]
MEPVTVSARAPGKINLELRVGPRGAGGFHELATIFHAVNLWEHVELALAAADTCHVEGRQAHAVPTDSSNLAVRAVEELRLLTGIAEGVALTIQKGVPVAGGMAGGSADAAAALLAADQLFNLGLPLTELERVAGRLGSDVAFCLTGGTALGTGRGELLAPVLATGALEWVLVTHPEGLSAGAVYAECDRLRADRAVPVPQADPQLLGALRQGDAAQIGPLLHNDLQPAAFSLLPALRDTIDIGLTEGAVGGLVSGSGPTCAFLAEDAEDADDLANILSQKGFPGEVLRATGPAHAGVLGVADLL